MMKDYLEEKHLHKNGLRFFTGDTRGPLSKRPEIGPAEFPIVPSYQLDRGSYETDLRGFFEDAGGVLLEGRSVRAFELGTAGEAHRITLDSGAELQARWMVDASGRARLISKRLDLRRPSPNRASAAWFRVKGRIRVADLVPESDARWHARDVDGNRWLSTVHLMGQGYWVWLIPLSTGYTSVGIVADHEHHPFGTYNKPERAWQWLQRHEPVLAERLGEDAGGPQSEDFRVVHNYSYLTERAFSSEDRWACVGEAALFVDPLYSLGSDFLGMTNSYATRLIADELNGVDTEERTKVCNALNETLTLLGRDAARTLGGNGKIFPHADVFGAKLWWDFFNYWSFMCGHFFQRIYLESSERLERFLEMGQRYYHLNTQAQAILENWAHLKSSTSDAKSFVPLPMFPSVLADQHLSLMEKRSADETLAKMVADLATGKALVTELLAHALRDLGEGKAEAFGQALAPLGPWDLPTSPRFEADTLPRRERLRALPPIGRDLERALGRREGDRPLPHLWEVARAEF
ncbi:MAG: tryptophan 7-halogenase [Myxococcota bacterium]